MVNLETGFKTSIFRPYNDVSIENWGWDGGGNIKYLYDEEMLKAAEDMMYTSNDDEYLEGWQRYQLRYNYLLPTIPLYSDLYQAFYISKLKDFEVTSEWTWTNDFFSQK